MGYNPWGHTSVGHNLVTKKQLSNRLVCVCVCVCVCVSYLFIYGCSRSSLLHGLSVVAEIGGYSLVVVCEPSHCDGFSCCGVWALGQEVFSSCG